MSYEAREKWIRDQICQKNSQHMKADRHRYLIITDIKPEQEDVQLGSEWKCRLINDASKRNWFVRVYEKLTEREFTICITLI